MCAIEKFSSSFNIQCDAFVGWKSFWEMLAPNVCWLYLWKLQSKAPLEYYYAEENVIVKKSRDVRFFNFSGEKNLEIVSFICFQQQILHIFVKIPVFLEKKLVTTKEMNQSRLMMILKFMVISYQHFDNHLSRGCNRSMIFDSCLIGS